MSDTFSADTKAIGGAVVAAGAGGTIAALTGLLAGSYYRVRVVAGMSGTIDTTNVQNLRLTSGGATVFTPLPSVALAFPMEFDLHVPSTDLTLIAIGAFAASSIVSAAIMATRLG